MYTLPPEVILVLAKNVVGGGVYREYVENDEGVLWSWLVEDWDEELGSVGEVEVGVVLVEVGQVREKSVWVGKVTKLFVVCTTWLVSTIVVTPPALYGGGCNASVLVAEE